MDTENSNFTKKTAAEFMHDEIKHVCTEFDKRYAGSNGEKQAAQYMADKLSEDCDEVKIERFKLSPSAYMGWIYITATFLLLAFVAYFFSALVSIVLIIVGLIPFFVEFLMFKRALDPLFPECESQNVTAIKKCSGDVKRRIFLNAHVDAPKEWSIHYKFGGAVFKLHIAFSLLGAIFLFAINVARWAIIGGIGAGIAQGVMLYLGFAALFFAPFWIVCYFITNPKCVVDGANDDLSGCFLAISAMKALAKNGVNLQNTEVGVILTGAKEVGLRGAKAWCEEHCNDYKDVPTYVLTLDTIRESQFYTINTKDMNACIPTDADVCRLVQDAAQPLGIHLRKGGASLRATDSAAFCQGGFKSAAITAVNPAIPQFYHTRYDTFDNINEDCLIKCFELIINAIETFDGTHSDADSTGQN